MKVGLTMNTLSPNIDFQLKPTVETGKIAALRAMESRMAPARTYRLHYPQGVSGELMTLRGGELEGLKTTSVMGADGIVAVAGLEPIDVTPDAALNLFNLWQFSILAGQINELAGRISQIERSIYRQARAELENIFLSLRDIARRVPECLEDSNYKIYLFNQLAAVKKDAGQYFQGQLLDFGASIAEQCALMDQRGSDILLSNFDHLKTHSVFKALELLAVVELFEIVIDGRFTKNMLSAAKDHVGDRSDQIFMNVSRYCRAIQNILERRREDCRQRSLNYYEHQSCEKEFDERFFRMDDCFQKINGLIKPLDQVLIPELDEGSVRDLCVSSMDGMLRISKG